MISLNKVTKSFDPGSEPAVRGVDLNVDDGELLVLLGESGCGKTTTLKMINRLIEPTSGTIHVNGNDVAATNAVALRRSIGYVFQGVGLFPHMTVSENVAIVPRLLKWPASQVEQRVRELLELVNMPWQDFHDRTPDQLSGGQRQRIGLARALAAKPTIMLMDEPFGALDPLTRDALQEEFTRIHRHLGLTTVMVTHDMTEALLLADRIAVMFEGRLLQLGSPHDLLADPHDAYVKQLMHTPMHQAQRLDELIEGSAAEIEA